MNMLQRSFDQFRIHWSCSFTLQQLKMRSELWIRGPLPQVFPYHSYSHQLSSPNPFSLPDVMTYHSEMLWRDSWRSNFIMSISTGGVFIHTSTPMFGCSPNQISFRWSFWLHCCSWQLGKDQGGVTYSNHPENEWGNHQHGDGHH